MFVLSRLIIGDFVLILMPEYAVLPSIITLLVASILKLRLHDTTCCQTGCQTGLTTGCIE